MTAPQNIIALIFDFDDTLADDSTTKLLDSVGVNTAKFWREEMPPLTEAGWDPPLAYLHLMLRQTAPGMPLHGLTNAALREFGSKLEFYPGIPDLFGDLEALTREHKASRPAIEFYIVSGGLEEVIRGSRVAQYMTGIRGCRFAEQDDVISHVMNSVSFTEKTRYIFEINKGFVDERSNPYNVNKAVADADRRIPLQNMIYVGDGLTDVPCFSLISKNNGRAFGVFDPKKKDSPKKAWEGLVAPKRVSTMNSPRYGPDDDLGSLLRAAVKAICLDLDVRTQTT